MRPGRWRGNSCGSEAGLTVEQFSDRPDGGCPPCPGNRPRQRYALRTDSDAVLRVSAHLNPALPCQGCHPLIGIHSPSRMPVEEHRLADRVSPQETAVERRLPAGFKLLRSLVIALNHLNFRELRACLQTTTATDAGGQRVGVLLRLRLNPRPRAVIKRSIDRHPSLDSLQRPEQPAAVDYQIANNRKFRHGSQFDLVGGLSHECVHQ